MNFKKWTTALMLALAVSSCIQDEALNSEAAIDACTGADVQLAHINSDSKEINIYALIPQHYYKIFFLST